MALTPVPGFIGGESAATFPDRNNEGLYNFYVEVARPNENPKTQGSIIGTPGLKQYVGFNSGWGAGAWACATASFSSTGVSTDERTFFVTSQTPTSAPGGRSHLIEILGYSELQQNGSFADKGQLPNSFFGNAKNWKLVAGSTQMMICGNGGAALYRPGPETITDITNVANFPGVIDCTFQDGYFAVISTQYSNRWYISAYMDGSQWDALDYALASDVADQLVALKSYRREIWVFGQKRTEIWSNTGAPNFPFQRNNSAGFRVGCCSRDTVQIVNDSLLWVGRDENGGPSVFQAVGYQVRPVSTPSIDKALAAGILPNDLDNMTASGFFWNGHHFYALSIPRIGRTLLYDLTSGYWSTWCVGANPAVGSFPMHKIVCATYNRRLARVLIGTNDWNAIYSLEDRPDDAGQTIWRLRSVPQMGGFGRRQFYSKAIISGTPSSDITLQWNDSYASVPAVSGQQSYTSIPYVANPGSQLAGGRMMWTRLGSSLENRMWQVIVKDGSVSPTVLNGFLVDVK